jgi:hypothetical protein
MSIHSLPPELLSLVLGLAQAQPTIDVAYYPHYEFLDNLLSFSLVHSSWTGVGQHLLMDNVWIRGEGKSFETISQGVETVPFKTIPVKTLTLSEGGGELRSVIRKAPTMEQWSHIVCLRLVGVTSFAFDELVVLPSESRFTRLASLDDMLPTVSHNIVDLKDLSSEYGSYTRSRRQITLPRLSRLTLNDTLILTGVEEAQRTFSPSTLPRLTNLAFCVGTTDASRHFDAFFQNLLPQITSFALISRQGHPRFADHYNSIKSPVSLLNNLVNLSLNLPWKILLEFLVDLPRTLNLDSLHIYLQYPKPKVSCGDFAAWKQLLRVVASIAGLGGKGTNSIKAKKVYVYGKKMAGTVTGINRSLGKLCWVKGYPPFANFDGKFMGTLQ